MTTSGGLSASSEIVQTDGTPVRQPGTALDFTCATDVNGQHRIIVSDDAFGPHTGNYSTVSDSARRTTVLRSRTAAHR